MSMFGVKRSTEIQAAAEKKGVETIALFPVLSRSENGIIVGEMDSHLDFQTSILIRGTQLSAAGVRDSDGRGSDVVVTTVVHCHGLFEKAYITIIKVFHVLIVKYSLARVSNKINTKDY